MKKSLIILICARLAAACSPRIIERVHTEIEYRDRVERDSLYLHDSVYVHEHASNDTVYLDKFVYKYIYRDKFKTDSVYVAIHDTTQVEKLVEKELNWGQRVKMDSWWILLVLVLMLGLWTLRKPLLSLFKHIVK